MNVLFLSLDLASYGGIQRYSRYVIGALRRSARVSDVSIASLAPASDDGFERMDIDVAGRGRGLMAKLAFAIGVLRLARVHRADVLVCDHVHLVPLALACRLLTRTPYIVNVYAVDVWGTLPFAQRRALVGARRIVSDCDFTRRHLEGRYPALRGRIDVVRDCVDVQRFTPIARERPAMPVVLTVSRLAVGRSKGHDVVMEALAALRRRGIDARYVIAGDGADRPRLEAITRTLKLDDRVEFRGRVPEPDLARLYQSCDVFALVSAFSMTRELQGEGVPLVVLEAQACGKPAMVSSCDGSPEAIVDGETGIAVAPDDVAAVADALGALLRDAELRARMGAAARRLTEREFGVERFERAYDDALAQALHIDAPVETHALEAA